MNILLITGQYPPEIRAISFMIQELAEHFSGKGHDVTVITSMPQPELVVNEIDIKTPLVDIENGVKVIRVKIPFKIRKGYVHKALNQLSMSILFFKEIKRLVRKEIDAVIVYTPELPLGLVGLKVKKLYRAMFLLNVQDIFPQNAIDLGILRNKYLIKFFEAMERRIYTGADRITSHTDGSRKFLINNKNIPKEKISTVSNWLNLKSYKYAKTKNYFRKEYGLENRFIFLSAGIIGPSQNLDFIIQIAGMITDIPEICFLLVGDGSEKKRLKNLAKNYKLNNIVFKGFVSNVEYPKLAKEVDVGLLSLSKKNKTPVMPGKILGFMAASLGIVAFLHKESDGHNLIKVAQCGYSIVPDNPEDAANLIRRIYNEQDNLKILGENGYRYASQHFSKDVCLRKFDQIIK